MLKMLGFIDEASLKPNIIKTTGWAPVGARPIDPAPFSHALPGNGLPANRETGHPRTFIAGPGCVGLKAPSPLALGPMALQWQLLDGVLNRAGFEVDIEHERAPARSPRSSPRSDPCVGKMIPRIIF